MSPVPFTPEKECYSVLILQFFRKGVSQLAWSRQFRPNQTASAQLGEVVARKALEQGGDSEKRDNLAPEPF